MKKKIDRCYLTKKEEDFLSISVKKELNYLRRKLEEKDDEIYYLICCRLGDDPPREIAEKFNKYYNF
jgi:hypothetical protein